MEQMTKRQEQKKAWAEAEALWDALTTGKNPDSFLLDSDWDSMDDWDTLDGYTDDMDGWEGGI